MSASRHKKVKVWLRVRPTAQFAHDIIDLNQDGRTVNIHGKREERHGVVNNQILDWSFRVDGILHNASQDQVFETVAAPLVTQALEGYNGTLMCYGQTGAGKTFTMTGATENFKNRGIIPRSLAKLYREIEDSADVSVNVRVSYLEIYNEQMFDLLAPQPFSGGSQSLAIGEDDNRVYVKGLTCPLVQNEEEALNLLFEGETNRVIAQHALNAQSSRSHCIFTVYIETRSRVLSNARYTTSKINFVDLAGSERLSKTKSEGKVREEAMHINKSLSFLEQCVIALADKTRDHVPFRQSKLTHFLRDSIGGNCNTVMVANVWGEVAQIEETVSTLRFASRMMCIANEPSVNEHYDPVQMVKKLEKEIRELKRELAMHDTLTNRSMVSYDTLSEQQKYEIKQQVRKYVENQLDEIDIVNVRQIQGVFEAFKEFCLQLESDIEAKLRDKYTLIDKADVDQIKEAQKAGINIGDDGNLVGELDGQSFGVGQAPKSSKASDTSSVMVGKKGAKKTKNKDRQSPLSTNKTPPTGATRAAAVDKSPSPSAERREQQDMRDNETLSPVASASPEKGLASAAPRPSTPPTRNQAFDEFKQERGSTISRILTENKEILASKKKAYAQLARQTNTIKIEIDMSMEKLNKLKSEREAEGYTYNEDGEAIISEEEFVEIKRLKTLKQTYRTNIDELRSLKSEVQYCQKLVEQCRQRLVQEFDNWYAESFLTADDNIQQSTQAGFGIRAGTIYNPHGNIEDEGEKFERLHNELLMEEPESVPFYNARTRTDRRKTYETAMSQAQPEARKKPGTPTKLSRVIPTGVLEIQ